MDTKKSLEDKPFIYVAAPYSSASRVVIAKRMERVNKYCASLLTRGHDILSPLTVGHTLVGSNKLIPESGEFWLDFCVPMLRASKEVHILTLDGWEDSLGVNAEMKIAEHLGLDIVLIEPGELFLGDVGRKVILSPVLFGVKKLAKSLDNPLPKKGEYFFQDFIVTAEKDVGGQRYVHILPKQIGEEAIKFFKKHGSSVFGDFAEGHGGAAYNPFLCEFGWFPIYEIMSDVAYAEEVFRNQYLKND